MQSKKRAGETDKANVVFTNGVFDLLHPGHVYLLKIAKTMGGILVVGINSDKATKMLKGPGRPIQGEAKRKAQLEALGFIDTVIIFDDVKTKNLVSRIKPDIIVKGDDRTPGEIRKRDEIPENIKIIAIPRLGGYSTTDILSKLPKGEINT